MLITLILQKSPEMVLVDRVKIENDEETTKNIIEEYEEYENYDENESYESLTIEPLARVSFVEVKPETTTKSTKSTTKPLIELKKQRTGDATDVAYAAKPSQSKIVTKGKEECNDEKAAESGDAADVTLSDSTVKTKKRPHAKPLKQCNVCGLIVERLREHMNSHPDEIEFKCQLCPRKYLTQNGLNRHIDVQHADDR